MQEPSIVFEACREEEDMGHRGAPSAPMLSLLSAGPPVTSPVSRTE